MRGPIRILMMTDGHFLAHVSRVLEIGKLLRQHYGYEVVFAGTGPFMKLPREEGFLTEEVFTVPGKKTLELARKAGLVRYSWWENIVNKGIESDIAAIKKHRPHVVMGDMRWTAGPAAKYSNIPYVSLTNAAWTNYYAPRIRAIDDHFITNTFGVRFSETTMPFFRWLGLSYWGLPFLAWAKKNMPHKNEYRNLFDVIRGDMTLLADIPEYFPTKDTPPNMHYIGPILWSPKVPVPEWILALDPARPTVYVTMGSTGHGHFFESALKAFGNSEYQVVMTTGNIDVNLGDLPDNFKVVNFAPGIPILQRSSVVINHGGNGSVYQSLKVGVPNIAIPTHVDQCFNAQRVEDLGVGVKLTQSKVSPELLRNSVEEITGKPAYRSNAQRISKIIDGYAGELSGARLVHQFIQDRFDLDECEIPDAHLATI